MRGAEPSANLSREEINVLVQQLISLAKALTESPSAEPSVVETLKDKDKNRRKWLLGLNIAIAVVYIVFFVFFGVAVAGVVTGATGGLREEQLLTALMGPATGLLICLIPLVIFAIAITVIRYVAFYDLYTSCSPQNNVLFLVLSIVFTVTEPFFVFFLRKKDEGMPPRRATAQRSAQPQYDPAQTDDLNM